MPKRDPSKPSNSRRKGRHCQQCSSRGEGIFCDLPEHQLEALDRVKTSNYYKKGQVIFYEDNPLTGVFCIASGKIKLYKTGEDGKEVILRIASTGDLLGTRALLTDKLHHLNAKVIEDAEICYVGGEFIEDMIDSHLPLAKKVMHNLGEELARTQDRLSDLLNQNVRQRFARLILDLGERYGKKHAQGTLIDVKLSRAEFAALLGATPETVIRLISELKSEGILDTEGKNLVIVDFDALSEMG